MGKNQSSKPKQEVKATKIEEPLPIRWEIPAQLSKLNATHIVVQHDEYEFTLGFFQLDKPIILGPEEYREKIVAGMTEIPAKCIARISIAAPRMVEFIQVMKSSSDLYFKRLTQEVEEMKSKQQSTEKPT